ncbi:MAG: hypothetical protein WBH26_06450 [Pontimonas sp.]|jgi:hypothetical protein
MAMTLRLDSAHDEMVTRLSDHMKCSKNQAVLNAIEMADQRVGQTEKALARVQEIISTRDKELMDRLADA